MMFRSRWMLENDWDWWESQVAASQRWDVLLCASYQNQQELKDE
jgi:hypothetical protein